MLPCNLSRIGLKLFGLSRRRCYFLVAISLSFFLLNIILISNYLDLRFSPDLNGAQIESKTCELTDDLAKSAFRRMKTEECRQRLSMLYCDIDNNTGYPVERIENRCPYFDTSLKDAYIGCFNDAPKSRFLTGFMYKFMKDNTPKYCIDACLRAGFQYAGVEYTYECFCGDSNDLRLERRIESDSLCKKYPCPGNITQFCGGFNAISVYSTGILEKKKPIPAYVPITDEKTPRNAKILFLFQLNGRNIRQVKRVLKMLYDKKHVYYFHVDSRQEFMNRELIKLISDFNSKGITNIFLLHRRYSTIWGGTSLLSMFLEVVQSSISADWDYILNLSETDMPILSLEELENELVSHMGKSFLASHGYNTATFIQKQGFNYYFMECENRMWRIKNRTNFPQDLRIDGGSDWVIVHRDLAKFALDQSNAYVNQIRSLFSTILLPLEGFFHTLALNGKFCDRVMYKNLRLTNWKRKQGCRCSMLKDVVDWCGCSPIVLKMKEDDIGLEKAKAKALFFARKFESIIDVDAVAQAERQVLRFRPSLLASSSPVFNATWLNFYHYEVDSNSSKKPLFVLWSKILFTEWLSTQSANSNDCSFDDLQEINVYKEFSSAPLKLVLVVADKCGDVYEMFVERKQEFRIFNNAKVDSYQLNSMEFGVKLDLKEEIFREYTGLIDTSHAATILWHWSFNNTSDQKLNTTSPNLRIQWFNPREKMVRNDLVKPHDSINYAQYASLNFEDLQKTNENVNPGTWKARLITIDSQRPLAEISFPVFPDLSEILPYSEETFSSQLIKRNYRLVDTCSREFVNAKINICEKVLWSMTYPDHKSEFIVNF